MEEWNEEIEDEPEDEDESEDDDEDEEGDEIDADETDDDEPGEDQIALDAFGAMLEIDGDSEFAQASREALAAVSDSAMALKARRLARERRVALEQAAEQEAQARQDAERARKEEQEQAEQQARAESQERTRLTEEAQHLARERERLRIEQEQFEARRREEVEHKAAPARTPAHIPPRIPVEPERPTRMNRREAPRRRHHKQAEVRRTTDRGRRQVSVQEDEATRAAHLQQRALDEQKWRGDVRREEESRKARRERSTALAAQAQVAPRPPVNSRKKSVKRHKTGGRRADAPTRRAERPAMPAVQPMRPVTTAPPSTPSTPKRPSAQRLDLQRVANDFRDVVASATADLLKRPRQTEPPAPRTTQPAKQAMLTGADLASWRSRLRLTQTAAASRLGVGQGTISKAESKGAVPLGPAILRALAAALARERRTA